MGEEAKRLLARKPCGMGVRRAVGGGAQEAVVGGQLGAAGPDREGRGRTLVFAGDVKAAEEVAACLEAAGAAVLPYHRAVPAAARDAALATLARCRRPAGRGARMLTL